MSTGLSANSLKTYRHAAENWPAVESRIIAIRNILFVGIFLLLVAMDFGAAENWKEGSLKSLLPHIIAVSFVFAMLAFSFRRAINRQRENWDSFELLLGPDFVVRRMNGLAEMELHRDELTAIRMYKRSLLLQAASAERSIAVPEGLADFAEIRDRLSQWMPISENTPQRWTQSRYFLPGILVVELLLFGLFFVSTKSWLEVLAGVPLLAGLLWCLVRIQKSGQLSQKIKRQMWLLVLPLLAIAARLVLAIIHWQ